MSMRFIIQTSLDSIAHSIQIKWKLCKVIDAKFFFLIFLTPVTLSQDQLDQYKNEECNSIYHHTNFKSN